MCRLQTLMSVSSTTVDVVNCVATLTALSCAHVTTASRLEQTPSRASVTIYTSFIRYMYKAYISNSRLDTHNTGTWQTDGRTDRQTDRSVVSISHVSVAMLTRDKKTTIKIIYYYYYYKQLIATKHNDTWTTSCHARAVTWDKTALHCIMKLWHETWTNEWLTLSANEDSRQATGRLYQNTGVGPSHRSGPPKQKQHKIHAGLAQTWSWY